MEVLGGARKLAFFVFAAEAGEAWALDGTGQFRIFGPHRMHEI